MLSDENDQQQTDFSDKGSSKFEIVSNLLANIQELNIQNKNISSNIVS